MLGQAARFQTIFSGSPTTPIRLELPWHVRKIILFDPLETLTDSKKNQKPFFKKSVLGRETSCKTLTRGQRQQQMVLSDRSKNMFSTEMSFLVLQLQLGFRIADECTPEDSCPCHPSHDQTKVFNYM